MKDLADKLQNGKLGDHPVMPHWPIDPADVNDLEAASRRRQTTSCKALPALSNIVTLAMVVSAIAARASVVKKP